MTDYPGILYVEDDEQNRMIMEILLTEQLGLSNVVIFEDSSDFISRVQSLKIIPDVIFLDIHVRPFDGFEMLRQLRQQPAYCDKPIIAVTASVMNEEIEQLKASGFDGAIAKPIPIETFETILERILNGQNVWHII